MGVILKNNAVSTITTAISASDVGLAVAAGTGSIFPVLGTGDYFYATLVSSGGTYEIVKVTARVGDTMTIVRAQEDTTAQSFAAGSSFEARVTAASIRDTASDIILTRLGSTSAGDGASLVGVQDAGNYYAATTVEGVLQELGASGGTVGINAIVDNFTGDGVDTTFTLSKAPVSQNTIDVFINGVYQNKADFSFAGTTLTFTQAPPLGSEIEVCINTNALAGTVAASNVSYSQGSSGAVNRTVLTKLQETVSVKDFGAVGDGVTDDTAAIQAAIDYAFSANTKIEITGNNGEYLISTPIVYPAGSLVTFRNAKLVASAAFSTSRYMIEVTSQTAGICNTDLVFDNLYLDASHRGGCMVIDNYLRVVVNDCTFCHFSTDGIKLLKTLDSHECLVSKCFSFEYFYGEPGYLTPTATSVGFNVKSFDNSLADVVCYYTGNGMVVDAQYNLISQAHLGGSVNALHITPNAAFVSFSQVYIDSGRVLWEDPWNTEFVGCKFLHNTSDTNFKFIVLKPLSAGRALKGLKIVDCSFHNINAATVTSVYVDTSAGSFDVSLVAQCYIENNSFVNVSVAYTKVRTSLFQTAATVWSFDLSTYFPFGNVQKAFCSYFAATTPTAVANITNISGNTVTVTASAAGNGTVYLDADVNVGVS